MLEVDGAGQITFLYDTSRRPGGVALPRPSRAVRRANGNTLISDTWNHQVIEIDPAMDIVFTHGNLARPGAGAQGLDAPGDAKARGDFTGLTWP